MNAENHANASEMVVEGSVAASTVVFAPTPDGFTDLQSRFIDAYIQLHGNAEAAALEAGYGEGGAANIAMRNLAKDKIQAEIQRRIKARPGSALAVAIGRLVRVCEESQDDSAAVKAAIGLAHMFGLAPQRGPLVAIQNNSIGSDAVQSIIQDVAEARARRLAGK